MKLRSCHTALLTAVLFTLLMPFSALAQEDKGLLDTENVIKETLKQDPDTPSGTENPETRINKNTPTPASQEPVVIRDAELKASKSIVKTVDKAQKEEEKVQKEEEDPLSFNFLYYIIEKFKLSDIVE